MSELRADTITGSDGTGPVTLTKQSAAKIFVCYTGITTTAILNSQSFGVSSLSDIGTATTTINFTNNMSAVNSGFSFGGSFISGVSEASDVVNYNDSPYTQTTGTITAKTINGSNAGADMNVVSVTIHGDLA
jgi:hypothetical protein